MLLTAALACAETTLVRTLAPTAIHCQNNASTKDMIEGWTVPESRIFLKRLTEHATQREFTYRHKWRVNDLVIWDNQATMHRAMGYDNKEVRDMRRTTIAGVTSSLEEMPA